MENSYVLGSDVAPTLAARSPPSGIAQSGQITLGDVSIQCAPRESRPSQCSWAYRSHEATESPPHRRNQSLRPNAKASRESTLLRVRGGLAPRVLPRDKPPKSLRFGPTSFAELNVHAADTAQ